MWGRVALCAWAVSGCSDRAGVGARATPAAPRSAAAGVRAGDPSRPEASRRPPELAPDAADLVDITKIIPDIRIDIRYATPRNFTGVAFYPAARCLLRRDAALRLARAQQSLARRGLGLLLWDCYRPFSFQIRLWKLVPDPRYVAEPVADADGTPREGSKHNRGAAVDVTLVRSDGGSVEMPTDYDDFSPRAHRGSPGWSATARQSAELLEQTLAAEGFEPLPTEWWHFDAPGWQRYPLSDEPLDRGP